MSRDAGPRILEREAFVVWGTATRVEPSDETSEIYGRIWQEFETHHEMIGPRSTDGAYYGVSFPTGEEGVVDYVAGMAVTGGGEAPEPLVRRELPAARYAVLECPLTAIGETYRFFFSEWLPGSGYELEHGPVFERYPPETDSGSRVRLHFPIRER